jgi:hypothetical protein
MNSEQHLSRTPDTETEAHVLPLEGRPSYIHVQDPDGRRRTWKVSSKAKDQIDSILPAHARKTVDGISVYEVTSWRNMSALEEAVSEDRDKMIWELFNEISRLKLHVTRLEKRVEEHLKGEN